MQKNEAGFKMAFKKRNPDFKKPPKKISASIPATGDLRKHDQPTRSLKKSNDMENSSSSEEDVLEKTRKAEIENQKSEQAKLVEMALLEQVMNGQIDVMDLLKSGQVDSTSLKEKLRKQMMNIDIDGIPVTTAESTSAPAPAPVPAPPPPPVQSPPHKQAAYNPLMRMRDGSSPPPPPAQKQKSESRASSKASSKSKKKKSTGSISSESSESSSESSLDTDISSESDSDEDSHKLAKKVKKLKARNKKLTKKVKILKKKLKDKKSAKKDDKQVKSVQRNSHGQIVENKVPPRPQPPAQPQAAGALAPMTPQQYSAQQSQMRRQYDPQTGQYRDVPEIMPPTPPPGLMPQSMQGQMPAGMPQMPPMPLGQMPVMPPGPMPQMPMSAAPLIMPANPPFNPISSLDNEVMEIKNVRGNSPVKNYPSDDDLYLDVFKGKEKKKPKLNANLQQSNQNIVPRSSQTNQDKMSRSNQLRLAPGQQNISSIGSINRASPFSHQQQQNQQQQQQQQQNQQQQHQQQQYKQTQNSDPSQNLQDLDKILKKGHKNKPSHHERGYKPSSSSDSEPEKNSQSRRRKSSEGREVVVRSNAAKNLIKDFYEEEELAVVTAEGDLPEITEPVQAKNTESTTARGVTFSGKCIFCELYHTINSNSNNESSSLCKQGKMYLERYKSDTRRIQDLRSQIKNNTDKLVSLKNKKELMTKVIVENDVRKNERALRMEVFRKHIDTLPEPVKVTQEFGRKVVKAQSNQLNLGDQLEAAIKRGNSAARSVEPEEIEYDDLDGSSMPTDSRFGARANENPQSKHRRGARHSSESDFLGRNEERPPAQGVPPYEESEYGHGRRPPMQRLGPRDRSSREQPPMEHQPRGLQSREYAPREYAPREPAARELPPTEYAPREYAPREPPTEYAPREFAPREPSARELPPTEYAPREYAPREPPARELPPREYAQREPPARELPPREYAPREPPARELPPREYAPREYAPREPASREPRRHPEDSRPPFGDMRASPGPPPRVPSGLLQTPAAAGPPQRPPPAALLRTPGSRPQYEQPGEDPNQHAHNAPRPPRHGWSEARGR